MKRAPPGYVSPSVKYAGIVPGYDQSTPGNSPMAAYGGGAAGAKGELAVAQVQPAYLIGQEQALTEMLKGRTDIFVEQEIELLEMAAQQLGCPCIETKNMYSMYDFNTGEKLLFFREESTFCDRCLCRPYHKANIYAYDIRDDSPAPGQVLMQIYKPFRCGCCCACFDFCQAQATFFQPTSMEEINGPVDPVNESIYGFSKIPQFGGWFTPTINLMDRDHTTVQSTITGPTCVYGGCLEFCMDQIFQLNVHENGNVVQDGGVVKLKPRELSQTLKEAFTDADKFRLTFPATASDQQKAHLVGNLILLDYLFFETSGAIQFNPPGCTLCNMYCCGVVSPCHVECNNSGGDGG